VGAPAPPRAVKFFFRPILQEKCVSAPPQDTKCTPQPEQESIFRSFCWVVKKCTPANKILATPNPHVYGIVSICLCILVFLLYRIVVCASCRLYTASRHQPMKCLQVTERDPRAKNAQWSRSTVKVCLKYRE